uniref:Uncharacterized protein n=1 Tax=Salarias fasciatus TaxID=181472 RepID=A0A672HYG1_SALFA
MIYISAMVPSVGGGSSLAPAPGWVQAGPGSRVAPGWARVQGGSRLGPGPGWLQAGPGSRVGPGPGWGPAAPYLDLLLKDEECDRLSKVRDQLSLELEELTASLFQEAHQMVREANVKQANAEKQLKEALGKIDVLQAEVQALKTLVLSSPTSPVGELPSAGAGKTPFRRGHSRNKSTSSAIMGTQPDPAATQPLVRECREVDSQLFSEFRTWKEDPTLERSCSFLDRVYREDIYPCLTFSKSELGSAILEAVEQNTLSVEPVGFQPLPVVKASAVECGGPKKCALSGQTKTCKHRIKFGDSSSYYYVSPYCRYRITVVCNFFTYIRYIHQGLVKQQDVEQMFWEVMQLRREMSLAKLGFYKDQL